MPARKNSSCATFLDDVSPESSDSVEKNTYVAAEADHSKYLVNPVRGRLLIRRQKSRSHAVILAGPHQVIHGTDKPGMIELRRKSHRDTQIVMAHPGNVDARNREDFLEILERPGCFHLNDDRGVLVCFAKKLRASRPIEIMCNAEGNSSPTLRSVFELAHNLFRLLPGFDARHHDAPSADVENPGQRSKVQIRNP